MERVQKKEEQVTGQVMSSVQLARVMGNQAVVQMKRLYKDRNGPGAQGNQNHHILPNQILEEMIRDYVAAHNHPTRAWLEAELGDNFDQPADVIELPIAVHAAPHANYNNTVRAAILGFGNLRNMIEEYVDGDADIEDTIMDQFKTRVQGDLAANQSINY